MNATRPRTARRRTARPVPPASPAGPALDGLHVFCGADGFGHSPEMMAANSHRAGIPTLVLSAGADSAAVRWPPVRMAAVFAHDALSEDALRILATTMIGAGIGEVFVAGSPMRGPWGSARTRRTAPPASPAVPPLDGLHVFCGADGFEHSPEMMAASSHRAGIPTLVLSAGADPAAVRWPPVRMATIFAHDALSEETLRILATTMIGAGIDEVFVAGSPVHGPWTFEAS